MNPQRSISTISLLSAFLIGVILFITFGKDQLELESPLFFLAGLLGVALAVLVFTVWNNRNNSSQ